MPKTMLTMLIMKRSRTTVSPKLVASIFQKSIDIPSQILMKIPARRQPSRLCIYYVSVKPGLHFSSSINVLSRCSEGSIHALDIEAAHTLQYALLGKSTLQPLEAIKGGNQ